MAEEAYANHRSVLIKLLNDPFAAARHPGKLKKRGSKEEDATDHENGNGDAHDMNSQVRVDIIVFESFERRILPSCAYTNEVWE